jgi:hypothetical protein
MPVEDTTEACRQFLQAAQVDVDSSTFIPKELMTPSVLYDVNTDTKNLLIEVFQSIPSTNLILLILGEGRPKKTLLARILEPRHDVFNQPIVKEFTGKISLIVIDPELPLDTLVEKLHVEEPFFSANVDSITLVKSIFPLTPVYGPHKTIDYMSAAAYIKGKPVTSVNLTRNMINTIEHYQQRNNIKKTIKNYRKQYKRLFPPTYQMALRRMIYPNALDVLNTLVQHPSPLFISSRITRMCYRSFKYLLDMRNRFERQTVVRYEYTKPHGDKILECDATPIFPEPFQTCAPYIVSQPAELARLYLKLNSEVLDSSVKSDLLSLTETVDKNANDRLKDTIKSLFNKTSKTNSTASSSSAALGAGQGKENNRRNRSHKNARKNRKTRKNSKK